MFQNTNRGLTPGNYPANSTATHISNFEWINVTGTINDVYPGDGSCVTNPCCESERHIETPGHNLTRQGTTSRTSRRTLVSQCSCSSESVLDVCDHRVAADMLSGTGQSLQG